LNVRQHALDGDALVSEPRDGALEHAYGGLGLFVGADLDVSDTRVVVDDVCKNAVPISGL
jgi:hypothetical protein